VDRSLPTLTPADLDERQQQLYDTIVHGERAHRPQRFPLTASDGSLDGPFAVMLHAPALGDSLQRLGADLRFRTDLSPRLREIFILMVAEATGCTYERYAHERVGSAVGLSEAELLLIARGLFSSDDATESAGSRLCLALLESRPITDDEYAAARAQLSQEQLIEVTVLVGYYRMLAQLMDLFRVGAPD
jgi:4-carboxymuconolactone decarboxylase